MTSSYVQLQALRLSQLQGRSSDQIDAIVLIIRQTTTLSRMEYHFEAHAYEFGVTTLQEYLVMFHVHLQSDNLRVFSYLRPRGQLPFWALVAPHTGDTVLYNEARRRVYSFYRPDEPDRRMPAVQIHWVELTRTNAGWHLEEEWRWRT